MLKYLFFTLLFIPIASNILPQPLRVKRWEGGKEEKEKVSGHENCCSPQFEKRDAPDSVVSELRLMGPTVIKVMSTGARGANACEDGVHVCSN